MPQLYRMLLATGGNLKGGGRLDDQKTFNCKRQNHIIFAEMHLLYINKSYTTLLLELLLLFECELGP